MSLAEMLTKVALKQEEVDELSDLLKAMKRELDVLEQEAVVMLAESGLEQGVPMAGRSWRWKEAPQISVLVENREEVLRRAEEVGLELASFNTAGLKAWLVENGKDSGREPGEPLAKGTPFEGLVSEFLPVKLYSTKRT